MLENMNINRVMLHQIFKRNADGSIEEPLYNNDITRLEQVPMFIFSQRVTQALGSDSHSVEMEIYKDSEGSTFLYATDLINSNDDDFINITKKVAYNLAVCQSTRNIPEGIIVIFDGMIGNTNNNFIGIMKAEMQEGFQLSNIESGLTLEFIKNLILTPQQKFYKIGLFVKTSSNISKNINDYNCIVYDNNLGKGINSEAAKYFYDGFLGCKFKENNRFLTRQFYTDTKEFINKLSNITDEEKVELNYGLYAYTKIEQNNLISTKDFMDKYLKDDLKDDYLNYMEKSRFPATNICKDLTLLDSVLKNRKIKFTDNISLIAPSEKFKDLVTITEFDGKCTKIEIQGRMVSQD